MAEISRSLARFVLQLPSNGIGAGTRHAARRSLANFLAVSIAGGPHAAVEAVLQSLRDLGTTGDVPLFGRCETLDAPGAALANGVASAVLDFDSTQMKRTNIHPSGPVLPALFALAARRRVGGEAFLDAYVLGVEVACRLANAIFATRNAGWHVTGATGAIGAAAGVGRLLGLTADEMVAALGIAANQSGGLREMYGTMSKALVPGRAAQSGLYAALLAKRGFTGPAEPLEGKKGFARVFSGIEDVGEVVADLGRTFEIDLNIPKPYPCAIVTHATIDCAIALWREGVIADDLESAVIEVPPVAVDLAGISDPKTELEGKFSLAHCFAVALSTGAARVSAFERQAVAEPRFASVRARTRLRVVPEFRKEEARVTIRLNSGGSAESHVPYALGSLGNPMTDADLLSKFTTLAAPVLGATVASDLFDRCFAVESEPDIALLAESSRPLGR